MSLKLLAILVLCARVNAEEDAVNGYHEVIGIPKAYSVMALERVSRIIGGNVVNTIEKFPYKAGIICTLPRGKISLCGGALLTSTRVLIAAHCWNDGQHQTKQFTVVLGSLKVFSGGTRITTSNVIVHFNWNYEDIINDIAMVNITPVTFNDSIKPILLPAASDVSQTFAGMSSTATGFEKISDSQSTFPSETTLHAIKLKILKNVICQDSFTIKLHSSQLCTSGERGVGTCDGDSGGPLTVMWDNKQILVGIVSFGMGDGCAAGYPSVYTRVTSHLAWIQQQL